MTHTRRTVAWTLAVASISVFVMVPILQSSDDLLYALLFGAATTSFGLVGVVLLDRVAGNRIGSLLLLTGVLLAIAYGLGAYGLAGAAASPPWPGTALAFVLSDLIYVTPLVVALVGIPLVFPDGRLVSPRWRWLVWLAVIATIAQGLSVILTPGTVGPTSLPNPLGVGSLAEVAAILGALSSGSSVLGFGGAAASVWVRYRRGDPVERQQLKWLLAVAALSALFFPASFIIPDATVAGVFFVLGSLTLSALPIAIAIAILRYRLYEIDRIISRTIAYVLITGVLVGAYTAAILLLQGPLGTITGGGTIAVALSTLVAAALFQPLRQRVQV
ncbi:MAG TPA: hypothetical protein VIM25_11225, partial [Candidatus Limnocylindrales bacterium]